jgi:hypothetical protein
MHQHSKPHAMQHSVPHAGSCSARSQVVVIV